MVASAQIGEQAVVPVRRIGASSRSAFYLLRFTFVCLPVIAGFDKFSNRLGDWSQYLSPTVAAISPVSAPSLLYIVGFIEVFIGFLVIATPRLGAFLLSGWLALIIGNLVLLGDHLDIALRDAGLMLGALALAGLSRVHEELEFAPVRRRIRREDAPRAARSDTLTSAGDS